MKARIISPRSDELITELHQHLHDEGVAPLPESQPLSRIQAPYDAPLETSFLLVDLRDGLDYQQLADLHAQYPGARVVAFADQDGRAERTALTFGGADGFSLSSEGAEAIFQKGKDLALSDLADKKYRQKTGIEFSAGNVFINTKTGAFLKIPMGFRDVFEGARNHYRLNYHDQTRGVLSEPQCLILEALKRQRDNAPNKALSLSELAEGLYETDPKNVGVSNVLRSLRYKFNPYGLDKDFVHPIDGIGSSLVKLAPSYEDLNTPRQS